VQGVGSREDGVGKAAPVRGTQSFVGVMAEVWKRPGLVGVEIAWRWAIGVVVLGVVLWRVGIAAVEQLFAGLASFFNVGLLHHAFIFGVRWKLFLPMWLVATMVWAVVAGLGRGAVLRRFEPRLELRAGAVIALSVLRAWMFLLVIALWVWGLPKIYTTMLLQEEPNYVLAFALLVTMTLVLFVFWCVVSWVLQLAPLVAMGRNEGVVGSLRGAWGSGALRGKLIEINLVMGIVKVALVVLAMVFSACPLPFSSVETQEFLNWWWAGVALFYLVASDYFHVVRVAAYLRLAQAYEIVPARLSSRGEDAS
jgi:hypothetical protein